MKVNIYKLAQITQEALRVKFPSVVVIPDFGGPEDYGDMVLVLNILDDELGEYARFMLDEFELKVEGQLINPPIMIPMSRDQSKEFYPDASNPAWEKYLARF